jgi:hypothetical protein
MLGVAGPLDRHRAGLVENRQRAGPDRVVEGAPDGHSHALAEGRRWGSCRGIDHGRHGIQSGVARRRCLSGAVRNAWDDRTSTHSALVVTTRTGFEQGPVFQ